MRWILLLSIFISGGFIGHHLWDMIHMTTKAHFVGDSMMFCVWVVILVQCVIGHFKLISVED